MNSSAPEVVDRPERRRYEIAVGEHVAFLKYRRHDDRIDLTHVEVPDAVRGRGLADLLTRFALDRARELRTPVAVKCPYVAAWLERHPGYAELIVPPGPRSIDGAESEPQAS